MINQNFSRILIFCFIFLAKNSFSIKIEANNSPYDVVHNHTYYLNKNHLDELKAAESFNISNKKERIKAAITLYEILNGKGIDVSAITSKIPSDPNYIDSSSRRHIYVLYDKLPEVFVEKINDKWYYSQYTVESLNRIHKKVYPFGANIWATWFPYRENEQFVKLRPWQWIGIGIITAVFLFCFFLLKYFFRFVFRKILFRRYVNEIQDQDKIKSVSNLFSTWVGIKVLQVFVPTLFINTKYSIPIIRGISFVAATLMVLIVYKLVSLFIFYAKKYADKTDTQWDDQIVLVMQKFMKFMVVFLGLFFVLNTLDVNLATIIAGLSVGGLALALAAQDTVKNFIASVMIFIDKPFRIGDMITGDNFEGVVQEVGFRSTRIKTANDSLIYIANAKLSEMTIDNKGFKILRKFKTEIVVQHETPLYKLDRFIEGIRTILQKHPYTKNSSIDVFLTNISTKGIQISIGYTYKIYNQKEEFTYREFILKQILQLAEIIKVKLVNDHSEVINSINHATDTSDDLDNQLNKYFTNLDAQLKSNLIKFSANVKE